MEAIRYTYKKENFNPLWKMVLCANTLPDIPAPVAYPKVVYQSGIAPNGNPYHTIIIHKSAKTYPSHENVEKESLNRIWHRLLVE